MTARRLGLRRPTAALRAAALLAVLSAAGCASLPTLDGRTTTSALTSTGDTRLGRAVSALAASHAAGEDGVYAMPQGRNAFAARVVLARAADRSLDVQYYIWHADTTGFLLLEELWNAAERGVRVRLLVDDNGIAGLDPILRAFDSHPNVEVRLYNPYPTRGFKVVDYLSDFGRLNRRMHNKSFTADTQATIVGGRNVGDEYFAAGEGTFFIDMDALAVGPIAGDVGAAFDLYWNSVSAYPIDRIVKKADSNGVEAMKAKFAGVRSSPEAIEYMQAVRETPLVEAMAAHEVPFEWGTIELVCDQPKKTLGEASESELLITDLRRAAGAPKTSLDIVSPYFVPREKGTKALSALPARGVNLRIVTNSLVATDVGAVHAGYAKSRKALLRSGALLYELRPDAGGARRARHGGSGGSGGSSGGSSSASLHGKTLSVDRDRAFIGSFNLDPRSKNLNTEMGFVIQRTALAQRLSERLDATLPAIAYRVILTPDGSLEWIEQSATGEVRYHHDPHTGFLKRLFVRILGWLPIDSML